VVHPAGKWQTGQQHSVSGAIRWLNTLEQQANDLPESEEQFIAEMLRAPEADKFLPKEYGIV
jgi:hypothetical protein